MIKKMLLAVALSCIFFRPFVSQIAFPKVDFILSLIFCASALPIIALNKSKIKFHQVDIFAFLLCCALIISTLSSSQPLLTLSKLYIPLSYLAIFYLVRTLEADERKSMLKIIFCAGFILSCYGIYQYLWGFKHIAHSFAQHHIADSFAYEWLSRKRVFSLFVTPNAFAGYIIMLLPISAGFFLTARSSRNLGASILFLVLSGLLFLNLLLTQSLSSFLSLVLALGITLAIKRIAKIDIAIITILLFTLFSIIFFFRSSSERVFCLPLFSFEQRLAYCQEAFTFLKQHPFLGIGWGNFKGNPGLFVHNTYLQIWIELGLLGLIAMCGLMFTINKIRSIPLLDQSKALYASALFCALISFCIYNFLDFTFFLPEICWLWFALLGLAVNENDNSKESEKTKSGDF